MTARRFTTGRPRTLLARVLEEWPRWAQVAGVLLGAWQIVGWQLGGGEPNAGVMGFAASLLLFERAAKAKAKR